MSTIGYYICVPFAWLVRLFYNLTNSYGVALILFTLVIKLIMLPFQMKSKKSMVRMSRMSGKMQEIQKKYANNQLKMQEEMESKEYEATAGGGVITAVVSGKRELVRVNIDPEAVDPDDVEMLQDLVLTAVNEAVRIGRATMDREVSAITGGIKLPGII